MRFFCISIINHVPGRAPHSPARPLTHSEGALGAFAGALRQSSSAHAGRHAASHPGAPVALGPHHGLHGVAPDAHGSLEAEEEEE